MSRLSCIIDEVKLWFVAGPGILCDRDCKKSLLIMVAGSLLGVLVSAAPAPSQPPFTVPLTSFTCSRVPRCAVKMKCTSCSSTCYCSRHDSRDRLGLAEMILMGRGGTVVAANGVTS